jgi:hypothetical protein
MQRHAEYPKILFWSVAVIVAIGLLFAPIWYIDLLLHPFVNTGFLRSVPLNLLSALVIGPLTIIVGVVILRRQPRNVVGLLIMLIGEAWIASSFRPDVNVPWLQAINYFYGGSIWGAMFMFMPYFPDGKAYPPRYARLVHGMGIYIFTFSWVSILSEPRFVTAFATDAISYVNPFYVPFFEAPVKFAQSLGGFLIMGLLGLGLFSLRRRYQHGDKQLRAQVSWLLLNVVVFIIFVLIGFGFNIYNYDTPFNAAFSYVFYTWLMLFPIVGIGNAILRHRLYDIDIIIRRTVIYSILTTILAIVYFGGIVLLQRIFQNITGQNSELAIVASTLLIVAMFTPLRRRIQDTIDRRFYRRKYNAEQTIAKFNETLRDEVDLETLKANLVNVVQETLEPSSIRIWIKEPSQK